jgi:murein DD-endopeptidase MepM/ murein hydrolase activator NlpD
MRRPDYYGFRSQRNRARRRGSLRGSVRLGALFTVLLGINVYVFFFRGGTSIQDILKTSVINKKSATAGDVEKPEEVPARQAASKKRRSRDDSMILQGDLKGHLGLSSALAALKVDAVQISELVEALKNHLDMRRLQPRQTFELRLDPRTGRIRQFQFKVSPVVKVVVTRTRTGALRARREEAKLERRLVKLGGRVTSSLNAAISARGEGPALVSMFVNLFSWDINWYADPREGDEFRIVVEKKYLKDRFFSYGRILAAEYKGNAGRFQAFHYRWRNGKEGHYSPDGRAMRRAFLKMPLNFRRISSKFNSKRFHPVLHRTRGHYGVDYAAARGTPVWSVADGRVQRAGRFGGAGNMVQLIHDGNVQTVYMHLSHIAGGIKPGVRVKQRQVIGYVGSTGLATGAHLHYGVRVRGRHVDPLKFAVARGALLPRSERHRFLDELPDRRAALESIPAGDSP